MKVYIVNYRGTVYGVYDSRDKAYEFAEREFGRSALMSLDVSILERTVM